MQVCLGLLATWTAQGAQQVPVCSVAPLCVWSLTSARQGSSRAQSLLAVCITHGGCLGCGCHVSKLGASKRGSAAVGALFLLGITAGLLAALLETLTRSTCCCILCRSVASQPCCVIKQGGFSMVVERPAVQGAPATCGS
jgi:hypothetical protein